MKRLATVALVVTAAVSTTVSGICGQAPAGAEVADVLSGKVFPSALRLKDLDSEWLRVTVASTNVLAGWSAYIAVLTGTPNACYTRGDYVTLSGVTYLVAYRVPPKRVTFAELGASSGPPDVAKLLVRLTPETKLGLSLLNWRTIQGLTDFRPFNLEQEIRESEAWFQTMIEAEEGLSAPATSAANLRQLDIAIVTYMQAHDGKLPPMQDVHALKEALAPYVTDQSVFLQPETHELYQPNPNLSGKKREQIENDIDTIMLYEATPGKDGNRSVLFLNGMIWDVSGSDWEHYRTLSKIR